MGRSIKAGENSMGGKRHGLGARAGIKGIRRNSTEVWIAIKLRLRTRQSKYPSPSSKPLNSTL